jgi:hypothetical protein
MYFQKHASCKYYKLHFYYKPLKKEYMAALCDSAFKESELKHISRHNRLCMFYNKPLLYNIV